MGITAEKAPDVLAPAAEAGAKKAAENAANRVVNGIIDGVVSLNERRKVDDWSAFETYLTNAYKRYNQVKTLVTGSEPRPMVGENNVYVNVGVQYQKAEINTATTEALLQISRNLLILGTGGIGKSMLMRYLFLNTVDRREAIPVMLELRRIGSKDPGNLSIADLAYACMKDFDANLSVEQFEYSLQRGKFLFLFDGFDEVKETFADQVTENLQSFSGKYPQNAYIITSRPGRNFSALESFTQLESMMLKKEQAVALASKLWERDEKAREFCRQLEAELYEKHQDFAENPLLLTMMLLTFMSNNSIPEHLSDFYKNAYEALYKAHNNWNKGIYKREFHCKELDETTFRNIFSHFCFHTYFDEQYEFSEEEVLTLLSESLQKFEVGMGPRDYLHDLKNAVCLMVSDGDVYRFSHRSFQAYFAASYTAITLGDELQKACFYELISSGTIWTRRDYYDMLFQLEPKRFGANVVEKRLREVYALALESEQPEMALMRLQYVAVEKSLGVDGEYRILYEVEREDYFNVVWLFEHYCMRETEFDSLSREARRKDEAKVVRLANKIYAKMRPAEERRRYRRFSDYVQINFAELDESDAVTENEKNAFYLHLAHCRGCSELLSSIRTWLDQLDAQRKALAAKTDFSKFFSSL